MFVVASTQQKFSSHGVQIQRRLLSVICSARNGNLEVPVYFLKTLNKDTSISSEKWKKKDKWIPV
jgi:hypothetical protein